MGLIVDFMEGSVVVSAWLCGVCTFPEERKMLISFVSSVFVTFIIKNIYFDFHLCFCFACQITSTLLGLLVAH